MEKYASVKLNPRYYRQFSAAVACLWTASGPDCSIVHRLITQNSRVAEVSSGDGDCIGFFKGLQGICSALKSAGHYLEFYEWVFNHLSMLEVVAIPDTQIHSAVLSFLTEFTLNRHSRITFQATSSNSILLFKATAAVLTKCGEL
jgi:hypothetical protein